MKQKHMFMLVEHETRKIVTRFCIPDEINTKMDALAYLVSHPEAKVAVETGDTIRQAVDEESQIYDMPNGTHVYNLYFIPDFPEDDEVHVRRANAVLHEMIFPDQMDVTESELMKLLSRENRIKCQPIERRYILGDGHSTQDKLCWKNLDTIKEYTYRYLEAEIVGKEKDNQFSSIEFWNKTDQGIERDVMSIKCDGGYCKIRNQRDWLMWSDMFSDKTLIASWYINDSTDGPKDIKQWLTFEEVTGKKGEGQHE